MTLFLDILLDETKLICWYTGPRMTKTKKYYKILANWLFLIYYVLLFEKTKQNITNSRIKEHLTFL